MGGVEGLTNMSACNPFLGLNRVRVLFSLVLAALCLAYCQTSFNLIGCLLFITENLWARSQDHPSSFHQLIRARSQGAPSESGLWGSSLSLWNPRTLPEPQGMPPSLSQHRLWHLAWPESPDRPTRTPACPWCPASCWSHAFFLILPKRERFLPAVIFGHFEWHWSFSYRYNYEDMVRIFLSIIISNSEVIWKKCYSWNCFCKPPVPMVCPGVRSSA